MTPPEFSRRERLDTIGDAPRSLRVTATAAECLALARRFDLIEVGALEGLFTVRRTAAGIMAEGRVTASVTQACVATGDPVAARIDEHVALCFVDDGGAVGDEVEIDAAACDVIVHDGGAIDLGEAAAETMALALDPFPRTDRAEEVLRAAGVKREEDVTPATALASLKDRLEGRN